jgi:hypothetical protein
MTVRMEGSTTHLKELHSIPDVADYIDSLVLSVDQMDAAMHPDTIAAGAAHACGSKRKPTHFVPEYPDKS